MITKSGLGSLVAPVAGRISSPFGTRVAPTAGASTDHKGIDYAVPVGTPVQAAASGSVVYAQWQTTGGGNVVKIDHGGGYVTAYAHLSAIAVKVGQTVAVGQVIGQSGNTGVTSGPNLHFGLAINGVAVDPMDYVGGSPAAIPPPLVSANPPASGPFTPASRLMPQAVALIPLAASGTPSGPCLAWLLPCSPGLSYSTPSLGEAIAALSNHYGTAAVVAAIGRDNARA